MYPYNFNSGTLIRVNGIDGARMYQMSPNSAVALFDSNEDIFYVKQTDGAGFGSIRTFRFEEVTQADASVNADYMTRKEVEEYVEQYISEQRKSVDRKSKANDEHTDD